MSVAAIVVLVVAVLVLAGLLVREQQRRRRVTASAARRMLFPFIGDALSKRALDAALRIARAEGATLVPAYLSLVPLQLPLGRPLPRRECDVAVPMLEAIEQQAASLGVAVETRISPGRTYRHALEQLISDEPNFDRIVVSAAADNVHGFSAGDVAWLLSHVPGEVIVIRPAPGNLRVRGNGRLAGRRRPQPARVADASPVPTA
jgi:nucleotide-binding universal stress UspA family protein